MRLYDELFKSVDGAGSARCTLVPRGGGYFEGVKAVGDLSAERVVLYFPRECVEIEGENLSIGKYYEGDLKLDGRIFSLRVVDGADETTVSKAR